MDFFDINLQQLSEECLGSATDCFDFDTRLGLGMHLDIGVDIVLKEVFVGSFNVIDLSFEELTVWYLLKLASGEWV